MNKLFQIRVILVDKYIASFKRNKKTRQLLRYELKLQVFSKYKQY